MAKEGTKPRRHVESRQPSAVSFQPEGASRHTLQLPPQRVCRHRAGGRGLAGPARFGVLLRGWPRFVDVLHAGRQLAVVSAVWTCVRGKQQVSCQLSGISRQPSATGRLETGLTGALLKSSGTPCHPPALRCHACRAGGSRTGSAFKHEGERRRWRASADFTMVNGKLSALSHQPSADGPGEMLRAVARATLPAFGSDVASFTRRSRLEPPAA